MEKNGKIPVIVKFILKDTLLNSRMRTCSAAPRDCHAVMPEGLIQLLSLPPVKGGGSLKRGERVGGSV